MIVRSIIARKIDLPLRKPFVFSLGTIKELNYGIVEITAETKPGIFEKGLGEFACPWPVTGETQGGFIDVVEKFLKPLLLNRKIETVEDIEALNRSMNKIIPLNPSSKASVEMAVFDVLGKEKNMPVYELLGGARKEFVSLTYVLSISNDVDYCIDEAKQAIAMGFNSLKLKVGLDDETDLIKIKAISGLLDEKIRFSLDVNEAWKTAEKSLTMIENIKDSRVSWIEDPVRDVEELAKIKRESPIKIMADSSVWGPEDAKKLAEMDACDMFNIKLHLAGGILRSRQILDIAIKHGIKCIVGSCIETAIGTSAGIQIACLSDSVLTTELVGVYEITKKIADGLNFSPGRINVPSKPGLGIELV